MDVPGRDPAEMERKAKQGVFIFMAAAAMFMFIGMSVDPERTAIALAYVGMSLVALLCSVISFIVLARLRKRRRQ